MMNVNNSIIELILLKNYLKYFGFYLNLNNVNKTVIIFNNNGDSLNDKDKDYDIVYLKMIQSCILLLLHYNINIKNDNNQIIDTIDISLYNNVRNDASYILLYLYANNKSLFYNACECCKVLIKNDELLFNKLFSSIYYKSKMKPIR